VQIRFEITPSDHLEMLKVRFGLRARLGRIIIGIAGTLLGVFGYRLLGDAWIGILVVFAALTLTQIFMPYIIHRRIYHRNPQLFEMRTVTFTDDGVKSEKATGNIEAKWSSFQKFKETKNLFLTYQSKDVVGIVPKRAFSNSDDIAQFRNFLASKLPRE
jgi:YcxB-like protein